MSDVKTEKRSEAIPIEEAVEMLRKAVLSPIEREIEDKKKGSY